MSHKSSFNALLTGALLAAGSVAFAQATTPAPLAVGVYPAKQEGKIYLSIEKQPNAVVSVQLLASTGEELYVANLPQKGDKFRQVFDLHELNDGTYTLRIKQGSNVIVKSVNLRTTAPELSLPTRSLTVGN